MTNRISFYQKWQRSLWKILARKINIFNGNDLVDLLPLLQGYCEFYYQIEEIFRTSDVLLLSYLDH